MTRVHACDESPLPEIVFGTLEKADTKYIVPVFNADPDDPDLLFSTPTMRLAKPFDTSALSTDIVVAFDPVVSEYMNHYKERILEQARTCQNEWFTKTFDEDMLPDLWKDNAKKSATIKVRPSATADEPFAHYRSVEDEDESSAPTENSATAVLVRDENDEDDDTTTKTKTRSPPVLPAGTEIRLLLRLDSVWIGRSKFGANYVALQMLELVPPPSPPSPPSENELSAKPSPRPPPPRIPVREKLLTS